VLTPYRETAELCFDKYKLFLHLKERGIATPYTCGSLDETLAALAEGCLNWPLFIKPRTGSGSVGARKVYHMEELCAAFEEDPGLIVQEYMGDAQDLDADVYVDTISHEAAAVFTKKKLETKIGGANKTISFKEAGMVQFLVDALKYFQFNGPIDVDVFCRDGEYYLSEINPRFGGAYLHAYGAGVDFVKMIQNNINGAVNQPEFMQYEEGIAMLMYDSVVICKVENV
jgi:carbamoyl-phosphate synthase large subunit